MTAFVTSHLVVGDTPDGVSGDMVQTSDPTEAAQAIEAGKTAVLPEGAFDVAAKVLSMLGATDEHIDFQINQAQGTAA